MFLQPGANVFLESALPGEFREGEMIAIAEFVESAPVSSESQDVPRNGIDPIEIKCEHEDAIAEVVLLRLEAMMHHVALVKAGAESGLPSFA